MRQFQNACFRSISAPACAAYLSACTAQAGADRSDSNFNTQNIAARRKNSQGIRELRIFNITPAIKYLKIVIPAKAGIQEYTGCWIKSGMTE